MKIYPFFISLLSILPYSLAMSPRSNPGCIRHNSDGIRATMLLIYLENGKLRLALDLLDDETLETVGEDSLTNALNKAKKLHQIDPQPILDQLILLKKQKVKNEAPQPDLPD